MILIFLTSAMALCTQPTRSQLLSSPMNTIAKIGQRVELECSTNATAPLIWRFNGINSTQFEDIYLNGQISREFSSRYKVNTSINGTWNLVIDSVALAQAGTYRCENTETYDPRDIVIKVSAELIVIESDPLCGTNASNGGVVDGDYIQVWCKYNYSGNWMPVMRCTRCDGLNADADIQYPYDPIKATSSLITQLTVHENGAKCTFTCKMSLMPTASENIPGESNKARVFNIPYYKYLWNYTATVSVLYGPRNQTIILIDQPLRIGSRLECFADGNPAPNYEWDIVGKNIPLNNGSVIVISESMVSDEEQKLRCRSWNVVDGQTRSNETTFDLTPETATTSTSQPLTFETILSIGISIGALILCSCIAVIIYKIRRIGTNEADEKASGEPDQQPTYGIVNKVRKDKQEHSHREEDIPVYGEVKKKKKDKKTSGSTSKISSATEKKPNQNYTGADGTVYEEMSAFADRTCKFNKTPVKQGPLFDLVDIYASIDHTTAAPPPTH